MGARVRGLVALALCAAVALGSGPGAGAQATGWRVFVPLGARGGALSEAARVWRWQSPLPQGNDLRSVSFGSEAVGWAVGDAGTVMATADGGATWARQASGTSAELYRVRAVSATTAWASGALGTVLRTDDGGRTWRSLAVATGAELRGLAAASATTAWVVGSGGVILRTTDGGATWALAPPPTGAELRDVALAPDGALWASGRQGSVARSTDGGASWTLVRGGPTLNSELTAIAAASGTTAWAFGHTEEANRSPVPVTFATTDGGATWSTQQGVDASEAVALSASTVYAGGWRTTDGGASWSASGGLGGGVAARGALVWSAGSGGGVARSSDGGATWTRALPTRSIEGVVRWSDVVAPTRTVAFVVGSVGGSPALYRTTDGGATWAAPPSPPPDATPPSSGLFHTSVALAAASASRLWVVGVGTGCCGRPYMVARSDDGGSTWSEGVAPFAGIDSFPYGARDIAAPSATVLWVVGDSGAVARSGDAGQSWAAGRIGTGQLRAVAAPSESAAVAVGAGGASAWSTDAGATWSVRPTGVTTDLYDVAAPTAAVAWAVGAEGVVLRTEDAGASWARQSSGTVASLRGVAAVDGQTAWAVGDGGVIVGTVDGGATWTMQASGTHQELVGLAAPTREGLWAIGSGHAILRGDVGGDVPTATRVPGQVWTVQELLLEHPFTDTWTRRGTSEVFDAVQTNDLGQRNTFVVTLSASGSRVVAQRRQSSDGNDCDYTGWLAPDLRSAAGTYRCGADAPGVSHRWTATVG